MNQKNDQRIDQYVSELERYPLLSKFEEQCLALQYKLKQDKAAYDKLIVSNLRLVLKVAHEYTNYGFPLADLVQEGNVGLMKAVDKFEPERGNRLVTYAVWWIHAYIQRFVLASWSLVRVKKDFYKNAPPRDASLDEIDELTGEPRAASLADTRNDYAEIVRKADRAISSVKKIVGELTERESFVMEHRIVADDPETLGEIGAQFGISRERVRQIEQKLVKRLTNALL